MIKLKLIIGLFALTANVYTFSNNQKGSEDQDLSPLAQAAILFTSKKWNPEYAIVELPEYQVEFNLDVEDILVRNGLQRAPRVGTQKLPEFKRPKSKKKLRKASRQARRLEAEIEIQRNLEIARHPFDYVSDHSTVSDASSVASVSSLE